MVQAGWLCSLAVLRPPASHASGLSEGAEAALIFGGALLFVGAVVLIILLGQRRADAKLHGGLTAGRRRGIRRTGLSAPAVVLQARDVEIGDESTYAMVLEVQPPGQAPFRVEVMEIRGHGLRPSVGSTLPVCIDRSDPKTVVVDTDTLQRREQTQDRQDEQRRAEEEMQAQRQAAEERDRLLRGG